jgi:hypothetical protein
MVLGHEKKNVLVATVFLPIKELILHIRFRAQRMNKVEKVGD